VAGKGEQGVLAHWSYSADEWNRFVDGEWERFRFRFCRSGIFLALGLAAFLTFVGVMSFIASGPAASLFGVLAFGLPGAMVLGGLGFANYHAQQNRCALLRTLPPEIVITANFVIFGGNDYLKTNMYKRLTGQQAVWARIEGNPPAILRIDIVEWMARGVPDEVRLPIPTGQEKEAQAVVEHFAWRHRATRSHFGRSLDS